MLISAKTPHSQAKQSKVVNPATMGKVSKASAKIAKNPMAELSKMPNMPGNVAIGKNSPGATTVPKSYVMVISSYENVARHSEIPDEAAEQLGETINIRMRELNRQSKRTIQDLPEFKKLGLDTTEDLGDKLSEMLMSEEDSPRAFALLKSREFANFMDSTEGVHRSFADMMQDNGEEKLLFGALETISLMSKQAANSPSVRVKA